MLAKKLLSAAKAVEPVYVEDVFGTYLVSSVTNGANITIPSGPDISGKGGMIWTKIRSGTNSPDGHRLNDTARGITNQLQSNTTAGQSGGYSITLTAGGGFTDSRGWDAGNNFVHWQICKQAKFYTQELINHTNGTPTNIDLSTLGTVGYLHAKITNTTGDWIVWHRSLTAGNNLRLNTTAAQTTTNAWLSVSGTTATLSGSAPTGTYIIHAFAHDAGGFGLSGTDNVISCGSFTTNGSRYGSATLGYEPQWVLVKNVTRATAWQVMDNMRGYAAGTPSGDQGAAGTTKYLEPNSSNTEGGGVSGITATGFTYGQVDVAGDTYIYIAIRRGPMKVPTDGTKVFSPNTSTTNPQTLSTGFPVDLSLVAFRGGGGDTWAIDRLRGSTGTSAKFLVTQTTSAEGSSSGYGLSLDSNTGVTQSIWNNNSIFWNFRRAPQFFDEVCYTGNGNTFVQRPHNLTVAPDLLIVKSRSGTSDWAVVYRDSPTTTRWMKLNLTGASSVWGTATDLGTATTFFPVYDASGVNYVAHLFATCPGVSKVGSYTGTGTTLQINCGFTGGARFVLIKATSTTGNWLVWDVARGLVAGNDPYLALNSTAAEVTTTDWVDPYSAGFELSNASGNLANTNGVSYIFFAVA